MECPNCGKTLVFVTITVDENFISAFMCDCFPQPDQMALDIARARETGDDLSYDIRVEGESDQPA